MEKKLSRKELATTYYLHEFMGEVLRLLSLHFKGQTTLNHLRIGSYIGLLTFYKSNLTSNKDIADALDIPRSTVSRIVKDFIDEKWVMESPHPEDGRKKLLSIVPGHADEDRFERSFRAILNDLLQDYDDGKLVHVCSLRKSY